MILHVVDVADGFYKKNIDITNKILDGIGATDNRLVVLNKCDLLNHVVEIEKNQILFSTKKKDGVDKLKGVIRELLK